MAKLQGNTRIYGNATIDANAAIGNVLTDALYYSNGQPWDFAQYTNYSDANVANYLPTYQGNIAAGNLNVSNNAVIVGNLTVQGTTTTVNANTLVVDDKTIVLSNGAPDAVTANGSGIVIAGANANLLYDYTSNTMVFTHSVNSGNNISAQGNITAGGSLNSQTLSVTANIQAGNISTTGLLADDIVANSGSFRSSLQSNGNITVNSSDVLLVSEGIVFGTASSPVSTSTEYPWAWTWDISTGDANIVNIDIVAGLVSNSGPMTATVTNVASLGGIDYRISFTTPRSDISDSGEAKLLSSDDQSRVVFQDGSAQQTAFLGYESGAFALLQANVIRSNLYQYANGANIDFGGTGDYSNANVANYLPVYTGNLESLQGNVITTANISAGYVLGNGRFLSGISGTYSNADVANYLPVYGGQANLSNIISTGAFSITTGNSININAGDFVDINNGNVNVLLDSDNTFSVTNSNFEFVIGNTGEVTSDGNITAPYYFGNGRFLSGIAATDYSNANVANYLPTYTGNVAANNFLGNIAAANVVGTVASAREIINGNSSVRIPLANGSVVFDVGGTVDIMDVNEDGLAVWGANANIDGNINVAGYANIDGLLTANGNIATNGSIRAAGNITGNFILADLQVISAGDITGGNVIGIDSVQTANLFATDSVSATGNVTGGNIITAGNVAATGNVTADYFLGNGRFLTGLGATYSNANVANYLPTYTGNLESLTGNITTTANIAADYILGNGRFLTGTYSNIEVADYLASNSNVTVTVGTSPITTQGNITGGYVFGNGSFLTGLASTYSNANVANYLPTYTGNLDSLAGNVTTAGNISAAFVLGNIRFATGLVASYSNANVANYLPNYTGNLESLTGNVITTANVGGLYILGNGRYLQGIEPGYGNTDVANYLAVYNGNILAGNINVSNNMVVLGNLEVQGTTTTINANTLTIEDRDITLANGATTAAQANGAGIVVGEGNIANFVYLSTPNSWVSSHNIAAPGFTATGNITADYFLGNGRFLTGLPEAYSNANVANYLPTYTGNLESLAGNVYTTANIGGLYVLGNGRFLQGITADYSNTNVAAYLASNANISVEIQGNIVTHSNVVANALRTTGTGVTTINSASDINLNAGNGLGQVNVTGSIWSNANIAGGFIFGNGAFLTGITGGAGNYSNANVANYLPTYTGGLPSLTGAVTTTATVTAGQLRTSATEIALGDGAGQTNQGANTVAIGDQAALDNQGAEAVAIGFYAGTTSQGQRSVAIGVDSGLFGLGANSVAVGPAAGGGVGGGSGSYSVAVGAAAGGINQGTESIALGRDAARSNQGIYAVAIGANAAGVSQGVGAVAIGRNAGRSGGSSQGDYSLALGHNAGNSQQNNNTIIINATGADLPSTAANSFVVKPVRESSAGNILYYDSANGEITYALAPTTYSNANVASYLASNADINVSIGTGTFTTQGNLSVGFVDASNVASDDLFIYDTANVDTLIVRNIIDGQDAEFTEVYSQNFYGNLSGRDANISNSLTVGGNAVVQGNLQVVGNIDALNFNDLVIGNLQIILAANAADPTQANGAGIIANGANASMLYYSASNSWQFSHPISYPGQYSNSNVGNYLQVLSSNVTTTANISADYFLGNGRFLTGLPEVYGNADVADYLASNSNITITSGLGNLTTQGAVTLGAIQLRGYANSSSNISGTPTNLNLSVANDIFFVSGENTSTFVRSTDGLTWQATTDLGGGFHARRVAWLNGRYWAIAEESSVNVWHSDDLTSWTSVQVSPATTYMPEDIIVAQDVILALGSSGEYPLFFSRDQGTSWTVTNIKPFLDAAGVSFSPSRLHYGGGVFLISVTASSSYLISRDLINWTVLNTGGSTFGSFAYYNGLWISSSNGYYSRSEDAVNWTTQSKPTNYTGQPSAAAGLGAYVMSWGFNLSGNGQNTILISADGVNWTQRDLGLLPSVPDFVWGEAAFANNRFVIVTDFSGGSYSSNPVAVIELGYALDNNTTDIRGDIQLEGTVDLGRAGNLRISGGQPNQALLSGGDDTVYWGDFYTNQDVNEYLASNANVEITVGVSSITTQGNITGGYLFGNGAFLTGITGGAGSYSNANVANYLPTYTGNISAGNASVSGNITLTDSGNAVLSTVGEFIEIRSNLVVAGNANIGTNYFLGNGAFLTGLDAATGYSNANVADYLTIYGGNILAGNISVTSDLQVGGNITAGSYQGQPANFRIAGGSNGDFLQTDGLGNLVFGRPAATANTTVAGANGQLQFNFAGNLNASPNLTFESNSSNLTVNGNVIVTGNVTGDGRQLTGVITWATYKELWNATPSLYSNTANADFGAGNVAGAAYLYPRSQGNVYRFVPSGNYIPAYDSFWANISAGNALSNLITTRAD